MGSPRTASEQTAAVMAPISNSSKDLPFEPASMIRLVRGFLACDKDASDDLPDVEAAGMLLWDLSADSDAAAGLLELHLLPAISAQLDAFLTGKLPGQSAPADVQNPSSQQPAAATEPQLPDSPTKATINQGTPAGTHPAAAAVAGSPPASTNPAPAAAAADAGDTQHPSAGSSRPHAAPERVVEICCGILANLYSTPAVVPMLVSCSDLKQSLTGLMLGLADPPALSELCRLLTAALSCPEGRSVWLSVLLSPEAVAWLLHIISNTLHPQLLERSLLLLAALLATTQDLPAFPTDVSAAGDTATAAAADAPAAGDCTEVATPPPAAAAAGDKPRVSVPCSAAAGEAAEQTAAAAAQTAAAAGDAQHDGPAGSAAADTVNINRMHPGQQLQEQQQGLQNGTAVSISAISPVHATQLLLQQGLLQALEAVLLPAAAPGARQQQRVLLQARSHQQQGDIDATPGSWSEEEDEQEAVSLSAVGLPGGNMQHNTRLYQDAEVLLTLVTCLQQLGQDEAVVRTVLKERPVLPELLLQLMLACRMWDQQEVLELLLPVLVMFRQGVGPLLHAPDWQSASPTASEQEQQGWGMWALHTQQQPEPDEQLVIEEHVKDSAVYCMYYWVCIAGVLRDCGPDSLDAIDAAWYLLNVMSGAEGLLRLFLQSSKTTGGVSPVWVTRQLEQLNRCIDGCRSTVSCHVNANRAKRSLCSATTLVEHDLLCAAREAAGL